MERLKVAPGWTVRIQNEYRHGLRLTVFKGGNGRPRFGDGNGKTFPSEATANQWCLDHGYLQPEFSGAATMKKVHKEAIRGLTVEAQQKIRRARSVLDINSAVRDLTVHLSVLDKPRYSLIWATALWAYAKRIRRDLYEVKVGVHNADVPLRKAEQRVQYGPRQERLFAAKPLYNMDLLRS